MVDLRLARTVRRHDVHLTAPALAATPPALASVLTVSPSSRARHAGIHVATAAAALALAACGSTTTKAVTAHKSPKPARWTTFVHVTGPLDLAGPRHDGSLVLEAAGRLWLLGVTGQIRRFAPAYTSPGGTEPYITQASGGCFGNQTVYALRLRAGRGMVAITPRAVGRLIRIRARGLLDGIAFDQTGEFGHRLLVTITAAGKTTVEAIDCHGGVTTVARNAPRVEGGIAVAPGTFGRFAGDLIASSEQLGKVFAITPHGKSLVVADSGLPRGQDIGVESEAFVPSGKRDALVADRVSLGNPHPGDNVVLRIQAAALNAAGVRPGDLLVAGEGGALTDAISCSPPGCKVKYVAGGPSRAHVEGHIAFAASP
ncbi:MAG: hypothetical protein JO321_13935 [Solirubrobacterales bacterium]|nr:hypothetical protein [Solirubrobacterales bacterium]MBV9165137.1 hypothetical protein [Solirubrobacterales bacterium]MBV9536502.1 hypothetical protein [Solirubrobacterales bacterium]